MTPPDAFPILYARVSKGPTVLAEIVPAAGDADLRSLAARCVEAAPCFHRLYTHTAGGRIYAFLMEPPLVLFAVAEEALGRARVLRFLRRLNSAAAAALARRRSDAPLCLQDELLPVLLRLPSHQDKPPPPHHAPIARSPPSDAPLTADTPSEDSDGRRERQRKAKKKKRRSDDEGGGTMEIAVADGDDGNARPTGRRSPQQIWRRHVCMVLAFDLVVCGVLFAIWLSVCKGFRCITS